MDEFINKNLKGQKLLEYLNYLAVSWQEDQSNLDQKIKKLSKHIDHIQGIIKSQNTLAKLGGVTEKVNLENLIEDAIVIHQDKIKRNKIDINCHFNLGKKVTLDAIKLMQIMVNLIKNAIESIKQAKAKSREIIIEVNKKDEKYFIINIIDNGIGIKQIDLEKLFLMHFTTKKEGHGFGLHASALAVESMGGRLKAYSDGINQGAIFSLELPYVFNCKLME